MGILWGLAVFSVLVLGIGVLWAVCASGAQSLEALEEVNRGT